ncbi:XTP/dITP diphosphohydrolase [Bacillus fengqiuensis]|nr:XTP/dITP diphosphohydrolase [Bacillus fengqiuensis]
MSNEVIIATKNQGKAKEFESLFSSKGVAVKTLLDFPEAIDVEETGKTFRENAVLKAEEISRQFNKIVIADDSGLCIDVLNGKPGVYSARYAGSEKSDEANMEKVLEKMKGIPLPERTAHFHCALAVAVPGQETIVVEGACEGLITEEKKGGNGFGYDPIFYVPSLQRTMAQLEKEEKNKISHRANALKRLGPVIEKLYQ